jgi:hypothetical protein
MSIHIPHGSQARLAWRQLDRRTRREVTQRARRGLGHPDPRVAAIAVGRAQATLRVPLWRWVAAGLVVAAAGCVVGWLLASWLLAGWLDASAPGLWFWIELTIAFSLVPGMAARAVARWIERANLPMVGGASTR